MRPTSSKRRNGRRLRNEYVSLRIMHLLWQKIFMENINKFFLLRSEKTQSNLNSPAFVRDDRTISGSADRGSTTATDTRVRFRVGSNQAFKNWYTQFTCLAFSIKRVSVKPLPCAIDRRARGSLTSRPQHYFAIFWTNATSYRDKVNALQLTLNFPVVRTRWRARGAHSECRPRGDWRCFCASQLVSSGPFR